MKKVPEVYAQLEYARTADVYHPDMDAEEVIHTYFPESMQAFVQDMSDITAAFYGTMLSQTRLFWGASAVDALAVATITQMGYFKARQSVARYPDLPADARGLLLILIAGIFSASPEYQFRILDFSPDRVKANVMGKDRYYRIAVNKGVQELITWPTIMHFLRGANAELGWDYEVDMDIRELADDGSCLYEFVIRRQSEKQQPAAPPSFLQMPEGPSVRSYGQLSHVPLGKLAQYTGAGFSDLLRKAISLEAYNYSRLEGQEKTLYMLAEQMSGRKCGTADPDKDCYAVVKSRVVSGKKKHVTVGILDEQNKEVFDFTFDYYLWEKSVFEDKFSFLRTEEKTSGSKGPAGLPEIVRLEENDPYVFRSQLPAFSVEQCAEHYPGYPCVPALYIYQCLMQDALRWLQHHIDPAIADTTVDFMELVPVKMITPAMDLVIDTRVVPLSKKRFRFVHELRDPSNREIHLLVTADTSIL